MGKIGIITLNGYFNYGNRLQNYALQETLKKFNYEVETIWIDDKSNLHDTKTSNKYIKNPKEVLKKIYRKFYINKLREKRSENFKLFSNIYIEETAYKINENYLPEHLLKNYDYFVTGSDQVWNPYFTDLSHLYLLTFAPKEKRIAYSPSFGVSEIPEEKINLFTKSLNEMSCISVREYAGAKLIKELTGRDAEVLPDPTLLLSKEDWLKISKRSKNKPRTDYLLTYYLGKIPSETQELISWCENKYNLKVVNLANIKERKHYLADPGEFLDYINSASLFITDSFHGGVFSILFETPFIITDRKSKYPSMNSRITTLLSTFQLEDRHVNQMNKKEILKVDFSHVEEILNLERNKAYEYLNKSLKNE